VGGRAELPVAVDTWLMATQICINRLKEEASSK
jgi:hypothetical protein